MPLATTFANASARAYGFGGGVGRFSGTVTYVNGADGRVAGSTFPFTATSTAVGDWLFIMADGVNASGVSGGSGATWTKVTLTNAGGLVTTLFYRQLVSGDAGATFTVSGLTNAGPVEWVAYRGATSVVQVQTSISALNASTLVFSAQVPAQGSGRLAAFVSSHGGGHTGSWSAPANWTARVAVDAIGPKYIGDILSSVYNQATITFTSTQAQPSGQVGWLFEFIGS